MSLKIYTQNIGRTKHKSIHKKHIIDICNVNMLYIRNVCKNVYIGYTIEHKSIHRKHIVDICNVNRLYIRNVFNPT